MVWVLRTAVSVRAALWSLLVEIVSAGRQRELPYALIIGTLVRKGITSR